MESFGKFQKVSESFRKFQKVSKNFRKFQKVSESFRKFQKVSERFRKSWDSHATVMRQSTTLLQLQLCEFSRNLSPWRNRRPHDHGFAFQAKDHGKSLLVLLSAWVKRFSVFRVHNFFCSWIFWNFLSLFLYFFLRSSDSFWIIFKVTKVTTKHYWGYYWTQKWPKITTNRVKNSLF